MNWKIILILLAIILSCQAFSKKEIAKIKIENLERKVDLTSRHQKETIIMRVRNDGDDNISYLYLAMPKELNQRLFLQIVTSGGSTDELLIRNFDDLDIKHKYDATMFEIKLKNPIPSHQKMQITIQQQFYNRFDFLPKKINLFRLCNILQKNILSQIYSDYTKIEGVSTKQSLIQYGPYNNVEPFSTSKIRLHFENNTPFVVFKSISQKIEVSHWGNIAIEGFYKLNNEGAILTGEYGRVDYSQHSSNTGKNALKELSADLPFHSSGLYYTDEIGNISTSNAWRDYNSKDVKIKIKPRFSIFGGWKSHFYLGYNLPIHHYLFYNENNRHEYTLKQLFGFPFENIVCEEYELRIMLPEGAKNIKVNIPFEVDEEFITKSYSWLDFIGKPTVVIRKKLTSDYHYKYFQITYDFNQWDILNEPIFIFGAFLSFFMGVIFLRRIQFKSFKIHTE